MTLCRYFPKFQYLTVTFIQPKGYFKTSPCNVKNHMLAKNVRLPRYVQCTFTCLNRWPLGSAGGSQRSQEVTLVITERVPLGSRVGSPPLTPSAGLTLTYRLAKNGRRPATHRIDVQRVHAPARAAGSLKPRQVTWSQQKSRRISQTRSGS